MFFFAINRIEHVPANAFDRIISDNFKSIIYRKTDFFSDFSFDLLALNLQRKISITAFCAFFMEKVCKMKNSVGANERT